VVRHPIEQRRSGAEERQSVQTVSAVIEVAVEVEQHPVIENVPFASRAGDLRITASCIDESKAANGLPQLGHPRVTAAKWAVSVVDEEVVGRLIHGDCYDHTLNARESAKLHDSRLVPLYLTT
jgi:hypothetical protein